MQWRCFPEYMYHGWEVVNTVFDLLELGLHRTLVFVVVTPEVFCRVYKEQRSNRATIPAIIPTSIRAILMLTKFRFPLFRLVHAITRL